MLYRSLLTGLALALVATDSQAGPFRRRAQPVSQGNYQPVYQSPTSAPATTTADVVIVASPATGMISSAEYVSGYTPDNWSGVIPTGSLDTGFAPSNGLEGDGLEEGNAKRAARGLRPFLRDEGLTRAARECAQFRANSGLFGHTSNDFAFVPAGSSASSTGCAAYPAGFGWMSCCTYDNYTYAGAAWATGRDGRRYMHLFVR